MPPGALGLFSLISSLECEAGVGWWRITETTERDIPGHNGGWRAGGGGKTNELRAELQSYLLG